MSWSHALRRPRIYSERIDSQKAEAGDSRILDALAAAHPQFVPSASLGGCAAWQAVYRLRNTYGADIIETITGRGYRLSKRGLALARGESSE